MKLIHVVEKICLNTHISKFGCPAIYAVHHRTTCSDSGPHLHKEGKNRQFHGNHLTQIGLDWTGIIPFGNHNDSGKKTMVIYRPPRQPVWSLGLSHLCGQTGPESGRLAGTGTSSGSGHNLPPSGCSSKTLGCGSETQTLDSL